jgi:hypothetical protein
MLGLLIDGANMIIKHKQNKNHNNHNQQQGFGGQNQGGWGGQNQGGWGGNQGAWGGGGQQLGFIKLTRSIKLGK